MFTFAMCAATLGVAIIAGWFLVGGMFSRSLSIKCAIALAVIAAAWVVTAVTGMTGAWIGVAVLALAAAFMGFVGFAAGEN